MRVLVTGAGGMLAGSTIPALERAGHEVLGLKHGDADVTRRDALDHPIRTFQPDWIFHLAGYTRVDDCESHADLAFRVNTIGSRNVAQAASASGVSVLAVSTDYVFDGRATRPYREYDPAAPQSVYGASKWGGEQAVREIHPRHVVVRSAWLYGKGGSNFVDTILRKARAGEALKVVDDQRGSPTSTEDLAQALLKLATAGQFGTYHVTNSGDCTWYDLACHVIGRAGLCNPVGRTDTASIGRQARRPAYSVLNNLQYEHVVGDRMMHWRDAVDRYLEGASTS